MMIILGDRLGLYKALSQFGPMTSEELTHNTVTAGRYIREWLASQAAAGYLSYDPENKKFSVSAENAMVLADENSPVYLLGGNQILRSIFKDEDKVVKIFQTGEGLRWVITATIFTNGLQNFPKFLLTNLSVTTTTW